MNGKTEMEKGKTKTPRVEFRANDDAADILSDLSSRFHLKDGKVNWNALDYFKARFRLAACLKSSGGVRDSVVLSSIEHALGECAKKGKFDVGFFVSRATARGSELVAISARPFDVFCQINARPHGLPEGKIRSIHAPISVLSKLPVKLLSQLKNEDARQQEKFRISDRFSYAVTRINAVDEHEAVTRGNDNIEFALGMLNAFRHGRAVTIVSSGRPRAPLGHFLRSSTTLTSDVRAGAMGNWIEDSEFPHDIHASTFTAKDHDWDETARFLEDAVAHARRLIYIELFRRAVLKFQAAMSTPDVEVSLTRSWGVIEMLCSRQNDRQDAVIERASSLGPNRRQARRELTFIAEMRNQAVHHNVGDELVVQCAERAKVYSSALIEFALYNKFRFKEHRDVVTYLSLGDDLGALRKQRRLISLRESSLSKQRTKATGHR